MYHMNEKRIYPQNVLVTLIMAFVMGLVFNGIAYFTILDLEDALALLIIYTFLLRRSIILSIPALETKWNNMKLSSEEKVDVLVLWSEVLILFGVCMLLMIIGLISFDMII